MSRKFEPFLNVSWKIYSPAANLADYGFTTHNSLMASSHIETEDNCVTFENLMVYEVPLVVPLENKCWKSTGNFQLLLIHCGTRKIIYHIGEWIKTQYLPSVILQRNS